MGLEKIKIDSIGEILEDTLKSHLLFSDYFLSKKSVQKINKPTKIVEYDFTFTSVKNNRWLFIRIEDFFHNQKLVIMLNQLNDKKNVNLNVESFFISELKHNSIKQKLIFKCKSESELKTHIGNVFKYLNDNTNKELKEVIIGNKWIEMPLDWGYYK